MFRTEIVSLPNLDVVAELREGRLDDVYRAVELVDIPDNLEETFGPRRLAYQMRVDDTQIALQVETLDGEAVLDVGAFIARLSPDDMEALRKGAAALKKKPKPASVNSPVSES